ncbi:pentapeptide repeat-containing protein [Candidatus Poriferisodalis sp.]|uniref:pentapeptide repeat-containing protein n=1 Tax=Candidatus Poriferisodalis sp. TaxID=3101277 RepID=UPI003B02DCBD
MALIIVVEAVLVVVFWDDLGGAEETVSATLRNVGLLAAAPIAVVMALSRTTSARRAADTGRQRLLNERFQRAAEMLSSDLLVSRLSGAHALTYLAREEPEDFHVAAMSLLCALMRDSPGRPAAGRPRRRRSDVPEDLRVAMEAIGYRFTNGRPHIHDPGVSEAPSEEQNRLAVLEGLSGFVPDLSSADISWIRLRGADLANAVLTGVNADHADLSHSNLDRIEFGDGSARGAVLDGSSMEKADFAGTDMAEVHANDTNLAEATLGSSAFSGQFRAAELYAATIIGTNMSQADISCANLSRARLEPAPKYLLAADDEDFRFPDITQQQLDTAIAAEGFEPRIDSRITDPETGRPVVWHRSNPVCGLLAEFEGPRLRRFSTT